MGEWLTDRVILMVIAAFALGVSAAGLADRLTNGGAGERMAAMQGDLSSLEKSVHGLQADLEDIVNQRLKELEAVNAGLAMPTSRQLRAGGINAAGLPISVYDCNPGDRPETSGMNCEGCCEQIGRACTLNCALDPSLASGVTCVCGHALAR